MNKEIDVGEILVLHNTKNVDNTLQVVPIEYTLQQQQCNVIMDRKHHRVKMKGR